MSAFGSKVRRTVLVWLQTHPGAWTAEEIGLLSKVGEQNANCAIRALLGLGQVVIAGRGLAGEEMVTLYSAK